MGEETVTLRVVIADDSTLVRERMVSLIQKLPNVEMVGEASGVQAIECVRRLLPHVILLDINMPDGTGLDVLDRIRAEKIPTQVVILTNEAEPEYESKALAGGAVAFFDKSRDFLKAVDFVGNLAVRNPPRPENFPVA